MTENFINNKRKQSGWSEAVKDHCTGYIEIFLLYSYRLIADAKYLLKIEKISSKRKIMN